MLRIFIFLSFLISFNSFSQKKEGYFQYTIIVTPLDTAIEKKQIAGMLFDSKMELFFSNGLSRMDFHMGSIYENKIVVDGINKKGISLMSSPNGKFAIQLTEKEIDAKPKNNDTLVTVTLINEKRVILGFNCKKAILHQAGNDLVYWYTTEIEIDKSGQSILNDKIPGFPLYFSTILEGMKMEYQASNHKFSIEDKQKIFSQTIPPDYRLVQTGK
jgi:GLPGLI family protein